MRKYWLAALIILVHARCALVENFLPQASGDSAGVTGALTGLVLQLWLIHHSSLYNVYRILLEIFSSSNGNSIYLD